MLVPLSLHAVFSGVWKLSECRGQRGHGADAGVTWTSGAGVPGPPPPPKQAQARAGVVMPVSWGDRGSVGPEASPAWAPGFRGQLNSVWQQGRGGRERGTPAPAPRSCVPARGGAGTRWRPGRRAGLPGVRLQVWPLAGRALRPRAAARKACYSEGLADPPWRVFGQGRRGSHQRGAGKRGVRRWRDVGRPEAERGSPRPPPAHKAPALCCRRPGLGLHELIGSRGRYTVLTQFADGRAEAQRG